MVLVVPKGRNKHLTADALFGVVRRGFATIPDDRRSDTDLSFTDALRSAFALFSLTSPSLLALDKERPEGNWGTLYGMQHVPCTTRTCASDWIPCCLRRYGRRARVSCGTSSVARRWKSWSVWMATPSWLSTARGMFPPRRCTVRRVCPRSTGTGHLGDLRKRFYCVRVGMRISSSRTVQSDSICEVLSWACRPPRCKASRRSVHRKSPIYAWQHPNEPGQKDGPLRPR